MIALECPHCHGELYQPLAWFKEVSFTCPDCGEALKPEDFAAIIAALEEEMDAYHAELINGETPPSAAGGCCGGSKGHCGKGH
jgi:transcription initiation factor IIE alpha subunit